jgi:hypothetical protein
MKEKFDFPSFIILFYPVYLFWIDPSTLVNEHLYFKCKSLIDVGSMGLQIEV